MRLLGRGLGVAGRRLVLYLDDKVSIGSFASVLYFKIFIVGIPVYIDSERPTQHVYQSTFIRWNYKFAPHVVFLYLYFRI